MTPAARATALLLAVSVGAFAVAATAVFLGYGAWLRRRDDRRAGVARHLRPVRHRAAPRHEWLVSTVSSAIRWCRYEDGGPKVAVVFAALFLAFSVLMGANT